MRRAATLPVVFAVELFLVVTSPLTLLIGAAVSVATRSTRPLRSVALVVVAAALELVTTARLVSLRRSHPCDDERWQALMASVLDVCVSAVRIVLAVTVRLEEGSTPFDEPASRNGLIVLARHCGPGDTLFVAWLLVVRYRLRLSVVLKSMLRVIPAVDLAGDILPLCFVGAARGGARGAIADVAGTLGRGDALLLFPEGANYSDSRWREALRRLQGTRERWGRLVRNRHTLPPRTGGATAALAAAPDAAVLLLAHSGLGRAGRDRPWWRVPIHQELTVRTLMVEAADVPRADPDAVVDWLDEAWTRVDTWVEGHADLDAFQNGRD
jgi:1-acyl-sn-glycerol-3-phosphate acyltransferase